MTPLYFYLLLGSICVPLLYTIFFVDPIRKWKNFGISTSIMAAIFLIWDAIFTKNGVWQFNEDYCLGPHFFNMPIEEWLFFFIIPFCSLFIHYALKHLRPQFVLSKRLTQVIAWTLVLVSFNLLIFNMDKAYTAVNYTFLMITLVIGVVGFTSKLQRFFLSFIIILIPFFIVNGVLTGGATPTPVVIYDNAENLSIRLWTVPMEDIGYAFTMLFGNLMIFESLNQRNLSSQKNKINSKHYNLKPKHR